MKRVAFGFSVHTGWAALVAVQGPVSLDAPAILDRRRVEMMEGGKPEAPAFVYHAAAKLPLKSAGPLVQRAAALAKSRASDALESAMRELSQAGHTVVASGIVAAKRSLALPSLERILAAHTLIHSAEGELYRQAIIAASEGLKLSVTTVPAGDLYGRASKTLGHPVESLRRKLAEMGHRVGAPWTVDQKEGLLAALLALAG
ncbi:MAG TPA: hypothetical protein VFV14_10710 [Myxococcaceae bacterium]|nr:hypothetical protein [Myxococcaceae bacterium]